MLVHYVVKTWWEHIKNGNKHTFSIVISVFRLLQNKLQGKDLVLVLEIMKTSFFVCFKCLDIVSFILISRPPLNFSNCECPYMKKMIVHYFMECHKVCWSMETTHKGLFPLQRELNVRTRKCIPFWERTNVLFFPCPSRRIK